MNGFAPLADGPCYAVIFAAQRQEGDHGYAAMAAEMDALARAQPGFLGVESARGPDGFGITVSYWESEAAIAAWKSEARHLVAQRLGQTRWYSHYTLRIARVERGYAGPAGRAPVTP